MRAWEAGVVHICNPSTQGMRAGGAAWGQPGLCTTYWEEINYREKSFRVK